MLSNLFRQFQDLIPDPPLQVGVVISVGTGVATVQLPGGGVIPARGAATVGARVFVRAGAIEGEAEDLPTEIIEI